MHQIKYIGFQREPNILRYSSATYLKDRYLTNICFFTKSIAFEDLVVGRINNLEVLTNGYNIVRYF